MNFEEVIVSCGMDAAGSGWGSVADSVEQSNEPSNPATGGEFF
jgi:hypothetical protein